MYYYKFNIADWHLATSHLSLEEEAIYFRLINYYYDTESPIPVETQSVIRRLRLGSNSEIVGIILKEFFTLESDGWHHKRCDDEISQYHDKAEVNQVNGKKGGRPKKTQSVSKDNPDITLTKNQEPITKNHIKATGVPPADVSNDIFQDYLKIRKAKKSPWTPTAQKLMRNEAQKAGISLQEAMELCCARGWVGFKADWVNGKNVVSKQVDDKSWQFSNEGIVSKANELGLRSEGLSYQQLKDKCLYVMTNKALQ
jgi:uncharacterized protein YdaU (DUF1376 family)